MKALKLLVMALLMSSASLYSLAGSGISASSINIHSSAGSGSPASSDFQTQERIKEIIKTVLAKQQTLSSVSYELKRRDTIGTHIREMKGLVEMQKYTPDTVFGFKFWSKKTGDPLLKVFDGHVGYELDEGAKTYQTTVSATGFKNLLNGGGGHLVMKDLMLLDTSRAIEIGLSEDARFYTLKFSYQDLVQYDVEKRYKEVRIDKQNMLPFSVREHQESLGRIQDLYFEITQLNINPERLSHNFEEPDFLKSYAHVIPKRAASPLAKLMGSELPDFKLPLFANGSGEVSLSSLKGKVVLLDFWEVWCLPCIESMPKVEGLFQKYKDKGLLVYGVMSDTQNLDSSKALVKRKQFTLPMLLGNKQVQEAFKIRAIPLYVLLDKSGKLVFFSEGYSEAMEEAIVAELNR